MQLISHAALLLDEVAKVGSIRRAAEKLNTSASAVNRHILNLEAECGTPLFERLPRGMRLTAAGELLVNGVRRWRRDQEEAKQQLEELQGLRRGHARVGIMECLAGEFMPRVYQRIAEKHPNISLDIMVSGTTPLVEQLIAGTIDLAVCFSAPQRPDLKTVLTLTPRPGVVVAPDHPLAGRRSIRLTDCAEYQFILPDHSLVLMSTLEQAFNQLPIKPKPIVTTNSIRLMKALIRQHNHVAVLGYLDCYEEVQAGELAFIPISHSKQIGSGLSLVMRENVFPTPTRMMLVEAFRTELLALQVDYQPARPVADAAE